MTNTTKFFIGMAIAVIVFYVGLTFLPQLVGTCLDGVCGFTTGEIILSFVFPLAFIALPIVLEMILYRKGLAQSLSDIGITRFSWTGVWIAIVYSIPLIAFFPIFSRLTNTSVTTQPNAGWMLLNIILVNGFAEEIMMRGFVFRHVREGRPFWRAAAIATAYFSAYHFPLILTAGAVVGIIGIVISIPTGFITAYSYERGNNTIWGPVLLHGMTNGLAILFAFTGDIQPAASSLYLLVGILASTVILVRAYRSGYERTAAKGTGDPALVVNA